MDINKAVPENEQGTTVRITGRLWAFVLAEFEGIHNTLDIMNVPRMVNGEKLSALQRVQAYCSAADHAVNALARHIKGSDADVTH